MEKKEKSPYFQPMIDHIHQTWKRKKGFGYPFRGRDFKDLKIATRNFQEWQLMSLWDEFLRNNSEWVVKSGHSISAFLSCLTWLVDCQGWKARAREYEAKIAPFPKEIQAIINSTFKP